MPGQVSTRLLLRFCSGVVRFMSGRVLKGRHSSPEVFESDTSCVLLLWKVDGRPVCYLFVLKEFPVALLSVILEDCFHKVLILTTRSRDETI